MMLNTAFRNYLFSCLDWFNHHWEGCLWLSVLYIDCLMLFNGFLGDLTSHPIFDPASFRRTNTSRIWWGGRTFFWLAMSIDREEGRIHRNPDPNILNRWKPCECVNDQPRKWVTCTCLPASSLPPFAQKYRQRRCRQACVGDPVSWSIVYKFTKLQLVQYILG